MRFRLPATLRYGVDRGVGDPLWSKVRMLIDFQGARGQLFFPDASPWQHHMLSGSTSALSSTQAPFGGTSLSCPGSAIIGSLVTDSRAPGANDFCYEGWFYSTAAGATGCIFDSRNGGGAVGLALYAGVADNKMNLASNAAVIGTGTTTITNNVWHHWALCRTGSTVTVYLDGVLQMTVTDSRTYATTQEAYVMGGSSSSIQFFTGFLGSIRYTLGDRRYAAAFTPAAQPFPAYGPSA